MQKQVFLFTRLSKRQCEKIIKEDRMVNNCYLCGRFANEPNVAIHNSKSVLLSRIKISYFELKVKDDLTYIYPHCQSCEPIFTIISKLLDNNYSKTFITLIKFIKVVVTIFEKINGQNTKKY